MPKGGYRKPSNPAPVSGPGRLSRRTDGGPTDMRKQPVRAMPANGQYGARVASVRQQQAAPMAVAAPQPKMPKIVGMFEPNPDTTVPVTSGNVLGAGPGPEAMAMPNSKPSITSTLRRLAQVDDSGDIEYVLYQLSERGIV